MRVLENRCADAFRHEISLISAADARVQAPFSTEVTASRHSHRGLANISKYSSTVWLWLICTESVANFYSGCRLAVPSHMLG